jgi:hypothetical protein
MAPGLKSSTLELLKRFNRAFPQFYEQFVSSEIQLQNLKLAYQVYQTKQAVIEIQPDSNKSVLHFSYRNQSFLLSDIFGVLAAYGLTIHSLSLYGQIYPPMLVFIKLVVSRGGKLSRIKPRKMFVGPCEKPWRDILRWKKCWRWNLTWMLG